MKRYPILLSAVCIAVTSFQPFSALAKENPREKTASGIKQFPSSGQEGLIGVTEDAPVDNPADNIFHVALDAPVCENESVWLVYELEGVQDHTSVSRSINDQLSVGGYLVKKRRGWALQRERINGTWLRGGDNVVRFTIPENAQHSYRVRNLRLEVETFSDDNKETVIFNQPSAHYYFEKAYIKGLISGSRDVVKIKVASKEARLFHGEFESIIDFKSVQNSCMVEVEATYLDGTTSCHAVNFSEPITSDFTYDLENFTYRIEKYLEGKKPETLTLNGAFLDVPEGALNTSTTLSATSLRAIDIPALDGGMVNVTRYHAGFRFLPHGTVFNKEVALHIPYDKEKIPDGYTEQDIRTYYFDEQAHHWVPLQLDTVFSDQGEVKSKTRHFTDFIDAIIKVPESPEVEAYNSTSMKGIKAANPTAAVNLINPPQANNTGSASLSYPISIPAGRGGMQPQLSVSYSSGGGNGWMGLGWNLSLPMVSIDTRWGVPRFDPAKETETYAMNGEQLTPVAHRGVLQNRYASGKEFYPRVEGAFSRTKRYGDNTTNYFWEVTDKNGTKYFYGATKNGGFDKSAVLRDNEKEDKGNIAIWCLREVVDLNGNNVKYHYVKQEDMGVSGGTVKGYQIYIDKITYTGHQGGDGPYTVKFIRDRQLPNWTRRADVSIMANLGLKQVTADLLKKVEVQFDGVNIRSYTFDYQSGAFHKTLLKTISELDSKGVLFTTHGFDYYDDVKANAGYKPFADPQAWSPKSDGIDGNFKNPLTNADPLKDFSDEASALSGTHSTDFSIGMSVVVGFNANVASKSLSVGGNFGYSQSTSDGLLIMIDINGDGLSDKVFTKNNGISYRPNLRGPEGQPVFGNVISIPGIDKFHKEKSKTVNGGVEAHGPGGVVFVGASKSKTTSTTTVYFTEANGDQLPDVVIDGKVYFNRINPATGHPEYVSSSGQTPSPIFQDGDVAGDIFQPDPAELEEAIDQNPLHDVVRMWKAPYDGNVSITAPVQLIQSNDPARQEAPADGVRVWIQLKDAVLWTTTIGPNDYSLHSPANVTNLTVKKDDRIYFRVGSVFNGSFDQVKWSPIITYQNQDIKLRDANRKSLYEFSAKNDYVISSPQEISPPVDGMVRIESTFKKPQTTDNLLVEIVKKVSGVETVLVSKKYKWNEVINEPINLDIPVTDDDAYLFRVRSSSNVNWPLIEWKPYMYYTVSNDPQYPVIGASGERLIEFYPVPEFSMYNEVHDKSNFFKVTSDVTTIKAKPTLALPTLVNFINEKIYFSVKKRDTLLLADTLTVIGNQIGDVTESSINVKKNDSLFFEYHVPNYALAKFLLSHNVKVTGDGTEKTVTAGLYSYVNPDKNGDIIFGPLYRGWGHFAYKANRNDATQRIFEEELKLSEAAKNAREVDVNNVNDGKDLNNNPTGYDASKEKLIVLVALAKEREWRGYDQFTYLNAEVISSSRMGDDDISPDQAFPPGGGGTGARAINKISKSNNTSFSAGGGAGFISGSYGKTNGDMKVLTDFMDMNGDRYPDIVTDKRIQYTTARGGLSPTYIDHGKGESLKTTTESDGVSLSGSFVTSKGQAPPTNAKKVTFFVGTGNNTGGLSGNFGKGKNDADFTWMDINGDGLPDRVYKGGMVALSLGYKFADPEPWGYANIQSGDSKSYGAGLGVSLWNGSISAGIGLSRSDNFTRNALQDVNGDGLVDMVSEGTPMKVRLNTGNGFGPEISWTGAAQISKNSAAQESVNVAFTAGIYIPPPVNIKICFNPSSSLGQGISRDLEKLGDIDGDGNPDYLKSNRDDNLTVSHSTIGRTNLLKSVTRPLGAAIALNYTRLGNTYEMPNNVWTLQSVKVFDGFKGDGVDTLLTTYRYEGGFYERHEREFYGFKKVITNTHDTEKQSRPVYTTITQTFSTANYYEKGLLLTELMTDGAGNKFVEKENIFQLKDINTGAAVTVSATSDPGNAFPALIETRQKFYEGQSTPGKSTSIMYGYDTKGNIISYTDFGDEGDEDNISATITYHNLSGLYLISSPQSIVVSGSGVTYRKREAVIDPQTGDVIKIKQFLTDSEFSEHSMEYDEFGNLKKITMPKNAKDQRLSFDYVYDNIVHTYSVKVSNSYGYTSESAYDFKYGQLVMSKDANGNQITYELDNVGRVAKITGPYEKGGSGYTLKFEYHPEASVPWALTRNYDPSDPKNDLMTAIFVDGLSRVLQTKKDVAIYTGDGKADTEMMAVSGRIKFDAFGRTIKALYPITEPVGTAGVMNTNEDTVKPTLTTYDVLNRALTVTLPDNTVTQTLHGFESDRDGKKQFSTKTIDANGKQTEQFTDVKGRVTSVKNYTSNKPIWTSFRYNAINEQIETTDDLGHTTFSTYDNLGRRTSRKHPDAGVTTYAYDLAGNLKELVTANLQKEGLAVLYTYDFERPVEIIYPQNPENNVKYTYGEAGASDNRVGRVVVQEDATGAQEFFYGPLGEVVKNIRTVVIPQFDEQTYVTEWTYDTWNRLTSMVYPDGEKVEYNYNPGGLLRSMTGKKKNATFAYVNQLGYDKFGQRVFLAYGNGTKTSYSYEPDRRRLSNLTAKTKAGRLMMDNVYSYDKVNNILNLKNNAPIPSPNLMGGSSDYSYDYDDLYRLTQAQGSFKGPADTQTYSLAMSYNSVGGIMHKVQNHLRKGSVQKKTTYDLTYTYDDAQPHAAIHIGDQTFTYDLNGNQTGWTDDKSGQKRIMLWDEENRIRSIYDNGSQHHYVYDASGERVLKGKSSGQRIFVNGEWKAGSGQMGNYTVYVNPYIVLQSGRYTKHYYIENQRIVSKLGGGWDNNGQGPLKAGGNKVDYVGKSQKVFDGIVKNLKFLGADGQILTAGKSGKVPPGQINGTANIAETFRYFYHPDHLGSTSYVTDASGEVFQHLEYFAFGETFVEEHSNTDRIPYLFNGKELDEETGLYYYGARYYDPKMSAFPSVDPKAENFPSLSPFQFAGNQVPNAIDLDGAEPVRTAGGVQNLIIVIQGYGGDPPKGATQSAPDMSGLGRLSSLSSSTTQVVFFASSTTDDTKNDVKISIRNFRNDNPSGKVVIVGHSQGADNAIEMFKENKSLKADLLITLDIKDAAGMGVFSVDDNNVGKRVVNAINYYQEGEFIGGEKIDFDSKFTNGANILSPGSNHRSIDNDLADYLNLDITNFIIGGDAVNLAKQRLLPTFDPKQSSSPNISGSSN